MAESQPPKRPRFFFGQLLTAADFALEQQYHIEKHKLHNRALHGFGIVSGLTVTLKEGLIVVDPGLALDCEGNELVIPAAIAIAPPLIGTDCHASYVNLRYAEEASTANETVTTTESFEITFAQENCNRNHRHLRGRWLACGQAHALTIAKLKHGAHGWRVERGYRPPVIK
ncbi:MAG: hypothetical protein ACREA9_05055 [Pyrinomonadaceae bacterium]